MPVEFKGPNPNFTKMKKDGGDVKVDGVKKVAVESVNHQDFGGKQRLADTNPGSDRQSREVHGTNPAEKGRLTGMKVPKLGGNREIGTEKTSNEPPRGFRYNREGHKIENSSLSEGSGS